VGLRRRAIASLDIIAIGTNDAMYGTTDQFVQNLEKLVALVRAMGKVTIHNQYKISTI
jgi:lysophospholipase L1-like esterase